MGLIANPNPNPNPNPHQVSAFAMDLISPAVLQARPHATHHAPSTPLTTYQARYSLRAQHASHQPVGSGGIAPRAPHSHLTTHSHPPRTVTRPLTGA